MFLLEDLLGALRAVLFHRHPHTASHTVVPTVPIHPHTACHTASGHVLLHRVSLGVYCVLPTCAVAVVRFNIDFFSNIMSVSLTHNREKRVRRARQALEVEETPRRQLRRLHPAPITAPRHSSDVEHATSAPSSAAREVDHDHRKHVRTLSRRARKALMQEEPKRRPPPLRPLSMVVAHRSIRRCVCASSHNFRCVKCIRARQTLMPLDERPRRERHLQPAFVQERIGSTEDVVMSPSARPHSPVPHADSADHVPFFNTHL